MGGRVPYEQGLASIRTTLRGQGIDLDALLQEQEVGTPEEVQIKSALRSGITQALTHHFPNATAGERFGAQRAIERSVSDYLQAHPALKGIKNPSELYRLWQAANDVPARKSKKGRRK